ncbi:sugar transferase [Legionella anisa]|uniref:Sugar transferase n=1 Tax=Legionella anisa TaxID=28082 RepID=A0AAX0WXH2_9GAMM|nr:sugar transferase [Legionella anisa]AWN72716.1 sugar transferase [Legionella anisa]KTC72963.1 UDP-N-acetylgalactosamine-undecaprenyl-phosphate N-acetylgalactosaminephosphotransferase [Legionella anisa]MBN5934943.1 sugar transferase [Legionella anisa]MCW8423503.1 sugar transferase [Legionella anisa]MCW8447023.1 sugar transferase [Legionella anisa]
MDRLKGRTKFYLFFRSFLERVLSLCILILLSPVFLIISFIILITMGRPIFFIQDRMGRGNQAFRMYKFRTMRHDNQKVVYASENDPRVTKFGQIIRKRRLDELPQFLNILIGNMSLIGPRPEPMQLAEKYTETITDYNVRHLVKPGITGYAQVKMGYADSEDTTKVKVSYDLEYVRNLSLLLDIQIILKTIRVIFTGFGAR